MSEALASYKKEIALEFADGNQLAADAIDYAIEQDKVIITGDPFSDIKRIGKNYSQIIQDYLHLHNSREGIQRKLYLGEIEATDAEGVTTMNMGFSAANPIAAKSRGSWIGTLGIAPGSATKLDRTGM